MDRPSPNSEVQKTRIDLVRNSTEKHVVAISSLTGSYSPRTETDHEHVLRIAQSEEPLPPILVHHPTYRVIDGVHRLYAAMLNGRQEVEVVFFHGTEEEAFIRAVEENVSHGLPLPLADRKAAALRILTARPHLSDRAVARHTGLASKTVAALRRSTEDLPRSNTRMGVDGRERPLNGAEGRLRAAELIQQNPDAPLREIARIAGVSLGTAHDVRCRLRRGQSPIPSARSARNTRTGPPPSVPDAPAPAVRGSLEAPRDLEDTTSALRRLIRDPALRRTERGRELLRRLHARPPADWPEFADVVPPHCARIVALIARRHAGDWERLASALERKAATLP